MARPYDRRTRVGGSRALRCRFVSENPSGTEDDETDTYGACFYTEWARTVVDDATAAVPQLGAPEPLINVYSGCGFCYESQHGRDQYTNAIATLKAPVAWDLADETKYGAVGGNGAPLVLRTGGICVGMGGTFQFIFTWNTSLLPSRFFELSQNYGRCKFTSIRVSITPRNARFDIASHVWNPTLTSGVGGLPFNVQTVPAAGTMGQNTGMADFRHIEGWYKMPSWAWCVNHRDYDCAGLWNIMGLSDQDREPNLKEMADNAGMRKWNPFRPISFTRRPYQGDPLIQPTPGAAQTGNMGRPLGWLDIPPGGWKPTASTGVVGTNMPELQQLVGFIVIDTNKWPMPYIDRQAATPIATTNFLQDFTPAAQAVGAGIPFATAPAMTLNPPFIWDVTYETFVEFAGSPPSGSAHLAAI